MNFQPKTEADLANELVLPAGTYDFEVVDAEEKTSKAGNEMIVVTLRVFDDDGGARFVTDYLMEKMAFKLRHFCATTGLMDAYNRGALSASMCEQRGGKVVIQVEPEKKSPDGTKTFPAKNSVKDYSGEGARRRLPPAAPAADLEDDDIPF